MKKLLIGIIFILSLSAHSQNSCDSSLFYKLYRISQKENIDNADFLFSLQLVDSLSYSFCDHFIILPDSVYSGLTYTFGQICLKTNSEFAVKSFIKYRLKHIGSAE